MKRTGYLTWLSVALLLLIIAAGGVFWMSRSTAATNPTPAIHIESAPWQIHKPVELSLQTSPTRPDKKVSVTLLAPGSSIASLPGGNSSHIPERSHDFFGLGGVQLSWLLPEQQELEIAVAGETGAGYIGMDFEWRQIEPEKGQYDWSKTDRAVTLAKQHGLRLAPMLLFTPRWASTASYSPLDYQNAPPASLADYRNFVYAIVDRYKPHGTSPLTSDGYGIVDWVIWNEPNMLSAGSSPRPGQFWTGSIEEYIGLLRAGYEGAHAADPDCNVLNGGLADLYFQTGSLDLPDSVERLYDPNEDGNADDGARPFFDTLNVHIYQLSAPTQTWYQQRIEAVLQVMDRFGDQEKKVWLTETGYGTSKDEAQGTEYLNEAAQADAVRMVYETSAAYSRVERVFWWSLRDYYRDDSAANRAMEAHYGLVRVNFTLKPSYIEYSQLTGSIAQSMQLMMKTNEIGLATTRVPAEFISKAGTYIIWADYGENEMGTVLFYKVP